jgi:hypothetical protein
MTFFSTGILLAVPLSSLSPQAFKPARKEDRPGMEEKNIFARMLLKVSLRNYC